MATVWCLATLNCTATHMTHLGTPIQGSHCTPDHYGKRPPHEPADSGVQRSQRRLLARLQPARCMHTCRRAGDRSQWTCATMEWICVCAETCACDVQQHITHCGVARRYQLMNLRVWRAQDDPRRACSSRAAARAPVTASAVGAVSERLRALDQRSSLQHAPARATPIAVSETIVQRDHALQMSRFARATDPVLPSCGRRRSARPCGRADGFPGQGKKGLNIIFLSYNKIEKLIRQTCEAS